MMHNSQLKVIWYVYTSESNSNHDILELELSVFVWKSVELCYVMILNLRYYRHLMIIICYIKFELVI